MSFPNISLNNELIFLYFFLSLIKLKYRWNIIHLHGIGGGSRIRGMHCVKNLSKYLFQIGADENKFLSYQKM